jgi:molybdopterin/thiamine biosynthesis adenylyltransferase
LVHAGVRGWAGQVVFLRPPRTPCLACLLPANAAAGTPRVQPVPIIGVTAGVVGSIQATEAVRFLAGKRPLLSGRILFWDGAHMNFHLSREKRNPLCPVCGKIPDTAF